jgi:hypothetical protein
MQTAQSDNYCKMIGSDQVTYEGGYLAIYSRADMPDWYVKKYRKLAIYYEGTKYFLADKAALGNGSFRYLLTPWPPDLSDLPGGELIYDEQFVHLRDDAADQEKQAEIGNLLLLPVQPLIGFLPFSVKERLEEYGIDPQRVTYYSLWVEFLLIFVHLCLTVIANFTTVFNIYYLIAAIIVLSLDGVVRYAAAQKEDERPYGFYEWIFHIQK